MSARRLAEEAMIKTAMALADRARTLVANPTTSFGELNAAAALAQGAAALYAASKPTPAKPRERVRS